MSGFENTGADPKKGGRNFRDEVYEDNPVDYVNPEWAHVKKEQTESETEKDSAKQESLNPKEGGFFAKTKKLFSNPEVRKQFAGSMIGAMSSIAGVKAVYDVPKYMHERWQVRGMFGKGKGAAGSMEQLLMTSWKNSEKNSLDKEDEEKKVGTHDVREAIQDLNKRLSLTKEGSEKGSEQRMKIAELLRENRKIKFESENSQLDLEAEAALNQVEQNGDELSSKVAGEYLQKREMHLQSARDKMTEILDNYTTTKTTGMQAARETLNSACVLSGAMALRPLGYGLMDAAERFQRLNKESKIKVNAGEQANSPKFWRDVIVGSIRETYQEATLQNGGDAEKTNLKKGVDFAKAWGKIARYVGMGATAAWHPETMGKSIDSALGLLETKKAFGEEVGKNFQMNLERTTHLDLFSMNGTVKSSFELAHEMNQGAATAGSNEFMGLNHDNVIFKEASVEDKDFMGINHDNVIFKDAPVKGSEFMGLNHDNVIFKENPNSGINHDNVIFREEKTPTQEVQAAVKHASISEKQPIKINAAVGEKVLKAEADFGDTQPTVVVENTPAIAPNQAEINSLQQQRATLSEEMRKLELSQSPKQEIDLAEEQLEKVRAEMRPILDAKLQEKISEVEYQNEYIPKLGKLQREENELLTKIAESKKVMEGSYGELEKYQKQLEEIDLKIGSLEIGDAVVASASNEVVENLANEEIVDSSQVLEDGGSEDVAKVIEKPAVEAPSVIEKSSPQAPEMEVVDASQIVEENKGEIIESSEIVEPPVRASELASEIVKENVAPPQALESVLEQRQTEAVDVSQEIVPEFEREPEPERLDQVTKLKNGNVKFKYDSEGNIVGQDVNLSYTLKAGETKVFLYNDARSRINQAPLSGESFSRYQSRPQAEINAFNLNARMVNTQLNGLMGVYNELQLKGNKKEAEAILKQIYNTIDQNEKSVGVALYDRSKLPTLGR